MNDYETGPENGGQPQGQEPQPWQSADGASYRPKVPAQPEHRPVQGEWNSQNGGYMPPSAHRSYGGGEPEESRQSSLGRMAAGGREGGASRRIPYQYSTTGGWQKERRPDSYRWNYAEYDRAAPSRGRRSRGLVVFAVSLLCMLSVGLLTLTGYNIFKAVYGASEESAAAPSQLQPGPSRSQPQSGMPSVSGGGDISMDINSKPPVSQALPPAPGTGRQMTIPQVASAVRPSVVGIVNYQSFQSYQPATEGSGIILSEDGYIITNAHVIERAAAVVVVFDDDTEAEAVLVGADQLTDLAVLKVEKNGLTPAIMGDSGELVVGETVIAIGNPGGVELAGSVTSGIVSAINRVMSTPYSTTNYIQTDAAVNPGNSGGALCNEFGQVVGINTAKIVAEGYEGISFAIPITEAAPIIEDLIRYGRVTGRVLLGIEGDVVSEIIARDNRIPAGVRITGITSQALADAGVMRYDIITEIDGVRVTDMNTLRGELQKHKPGDLVTLTLYRPSRVSGNNNTFEVTVPLLENDGDNEQ